MNQWVNQPPSLPAGYVTSSTWLPEWAKVGSVMIRWTAGFTPSGHADKVPDSKSSANTVADGGGGGGGGGGALTVTSAVPLLPSLVAVIVALPAATPVTSAPAETVASLGALLDQLTVRPDRGLPAESNIAALSCNVAPGASVPLAGLTTTEATGMVNTVTADVTARAPPFCLAITR